MKSTSPSYRGVAIGLLLICGGATRAAEPPEAADVEPILAREIDQTLIALDSDDFAIRGKALDRLEHWSDDPRLGGFLAGRVATALGSPATSFEVRARLEPLAQRLPAALPMLVTKPDAGAVVQLLDRLHSDSSTERASAERQLEALLDHVELISPLWIELKQRALDPALTAAGRRTLEPLLDRARRAWLLADPTAVPLPPVTREQMLGWISDLTQFGEASSQDRFRREFAERELLDCLARDELRGKVVELLEEAIAAAGDGAANTTLRQIADFARPAMAAEVWGRELDNRERVQHRTVQYLIVGMPQFNEAAQRATHFDRVDEQTAHCVTGNSLVEGDYPVRVAIPHPDPTNQTMFYLTNLPTPRRRLAYEYLVRRPEPLRLREISQRTVDDFLVNQRVLSESQIGMLALLDPPTVSRFVGAYFRTVPDRRLVTTNTELARQSTVHRGICQILASVGTRDCVGALEKLARSGSLQPTNESPFQIDWIAALAIAERDPWPEVDRWLAGLVAETTPLVIGIEAPPELGASAAAILIDRHGASTRPFGLETTGEALTEKLPFIGYRFASDRGREDVLRWWDKQQHASEQPATP